MKMRMFSLLLSVVMVCLLQSARPYASSRIYGLTPTVLETIADDLLVQGNVTIQGPTPWADIRAFGATDADTNGADDDTDNVQDAIDSLPASGGVVFIPTGTFHISGVTVGNGKTSVRIVGAGRGSILQLKDNSSGPVVHFSGRYGGVENLRLECGAETNSTGLRLAAQSGSDDGVFVEFNVFQSLFIAGCTDAGIDLQVGPGGGVWYNTFQAIHVYFSQTGILFDEMSQSDESNSGANRNNFFSVRVSLAANAYGVHIKAGNTNAFFGLALENLTGTSTGVRVLAVGANGESTQGNRFYGTTFENVATEVNNSQLDTHFFGSVGVSPFSSFGYYGNTGIGTGPQPPSAKLHVNFSGGNSPALSTLMLSGPYEGTLYSQGAIRANGFQQPDAYAGGISLQRVYNSAPAVWTAEDVLNVTAAAKVGIGTTNPGYKLHVNGDAASIGWTNLSSRDFKEDVRMLDRSRYAELLAVLTQVDLHSYRYKKEYGGDNRRHLGLIAEDLPDDVLSPDKKGVDVYGLTSFAIGAMKAQQQEIEDQRRMLEAQATEIAALKAAVDRLTTAASDTRVPRP